jgi:hypothetical protein
MSGGSQDMRESRAMRSWMIQLKRQLQRVPATTLFSQRAFIDPNLSLTANPLASNTIMQN